MTKTKYIIAKMFSTIGIKRTQTRLLSAANELQLLKEAQDTLGRRVWSKLREHAQYKEIVEAIDQLLAEKSNLEMDAEAVRASIDNLKKDQLALTITPASQSIAITEVKANLANIKAEATSIKHSYDEAKRRFDTMKAAEQADPFTLNREEEKMNALKSKFLDLKKRKIQADKQLIKLQLELSSSDKSKSSGSDGSETSSKAEYFKHLGQRNKEISTMLSRIGMIENKIRALQSDLGKKISFHALEDPKYRSAVDDNYGLCKVMREIRKSIKFNHSLSGRN